MNGTTILNRLNSSEIQNFGGKIIATFCNEIDRVADSDLKMEIISEIGKLPLHRLMDTLKPSQLKRLGFESEVTTTSGPDVLERLGSLAFFLTAESWTVFETNAVKRFFNRQTRQLICLPEKQAAILAGVIIRAFGYFEAHSG